MREVLAIIDDFCISDFQQANELDAIPGNGAHQRIKFLVDLLAPKEDDYDKADHQWKVVVSVLLGRKWK